MFFENTNKIHKSWARLIKEKKRKKQITNIINEKRGHNRSLDSKRVIIQWKTLSQQCQQVGEIDKFLEKQFTKNNKIKNLNILIYVTNWICWKPSHTLVNKNVLTLVTKNDIGDKHYHISVRCQQ